MLRKLGIVKILRYIRSHMYTHCCHFNILEAIIYYQKPQPTQRCLTQVTYWGKGGGSRNFSFMPRCRFNVLNVELQKYIYYWSLEIF
jgi:hypothetical protein